MIVRAWLLCFLLAPAFASAQELGTIMFETSGAPAAQPKFLEGVKALHSFQFDEAAVAFREAKALDPSFALAYWGEAMSHNHPLWAQQDREAGQRVLESLAPTRAERVAKARLPKERALLEAIDLIYYGPDDKLARDRAYSEYLAELYARWPDDHEISIWYALSLLGTVRPGDTGFRRQALAASIAGKVFAENPRHPGAAHFVIHSFDDPDHAPLGLAAARAYADIAPAAAHALHMPAHIFVQLGMWSDVVASNVKAYDAAVAVNKRLNLAEGREDFHTLDWLTYGNLMLGRFDDARANVELARAAAERNPTNAGIRDSYLAMRGRYLLETEQWEEIALDGTDAHAGHEAMPGMPLDASGRRRMAFLRRRQRRQARRCGSRRTLRGRSRQAPRAGCRDECVRRQRSRDSGETGRSPREGRTRRPRRGARTREGGCRHRAHDRSAIGTASADEAGVRAVWRAAARGEAAGRRRARVRAGAAADTAAHSVARRARCCGRSRRRGGARAPRLLRAGGDARCGARLCRGGRRETLARRQSELK